MLSLWPLEQFIFKIRVLEYKTVEFARTSLSYRPIAALSTGVHRDPRSIRVFAQICGEIFAFLGLRPSVIARSRVQISDLAPLYRTVRRSAQHWMLCCAAAAQCAAGQHSFQYRPPRPFRPTVNQSPVPRHLIRSSHRRVSLDSGRYWMAAQPFTWVAWVKTSVWFAYRIYPF